MAKAVVTVAVAVVAVVAAVGQKALAVRMVASVAHQAWELAVVVAEEPPGKVGEAKDSVVVQAMEAAVVQMEEA